MFESVKNLADDYQVPVLNLPVCAISALRVTILSAEVMNTPI